MASFQYSRAMNAMQQCQNIQSHNFEFGDKNPNKGESSKKKKKNFHGKLSVFSNQSFPSSGTSEITHFAKLAFVKGAGKVGMISTCLIF